MSASRTRKMSAYGPRDAVTLFYNCEVLRNGQLDRDEVWMKDGKIIDPDTVDRKCDVRVNCRNGIVAPGFLDLQLNGAFSVDFLTANDVEKGVDHVCKMLPSTGTVGYCPTLITSPPSYFHEVLPKIKPRPGSGAKGAAVLGVHCEGPFISVKRKGAHPVEQIVDFQGKGFRAVEEMYGDLSNVKIITMAAEHEGVEEVIKHCVERGIVVSVGHSNATHDVAAKAVAAGASKITHLFNAMPAFHHRDSSIPGLLTSDVAKERPLYFGIIADGLHTHETALRMAYKMRTKGLCLVTDAIGPMGLPAGEYKLGLTPVHVYPSAGKGSPLKAVVKGTDTLSGSVASMDFCIRHFVEKVGCPVAYALEAATLHPAQCIGIDNRKGTLDFGKDADIVILDRKLNVVKTYIDGELAFDARAERKKAEKAARSAQETSSVLKGEI